MNNMNTAKQKDNRVVFKDHRLAYEGQVWTINGKADPKTGQLKIYRIEGDVTKPALLREALQSLADSVGFALGAGLSGTAARDVATETGE